jgi:hypothetical protein
MRVSEPVAPDSAAAVAAPTKRRGSFLKGCGCVTGLLVMALGILVIGHFDAGAWASALSAIVIGILVFALSGTNGFWED